MEKRKLDKKRISQCAIIAFAFSFMINIFGPLEMYLSEKAEYLFSGKEFLPYCIVIFIVLGAALWGVMLIADLIHSVFFKIICALLMGIYIAGYIQGNYIVTNYGAMNGETIDWSQFRTEGIVSIVLWIAVIAIVLTAFFLIDNVKLLRVVTIVSICLVLIQISTVVTLLIQHDGLNKRPQYIATTEGESSISSYKNVIVFVLDTFDSYAMRNIIAGDTDGIYTGWMEDFTYYPDTLGAYPATNLSIPLILTGKSYMNESTYAQYVDEAFSSSELFTSMRSNGWNCGVYSSNLMPQDEDVVSGITNLRCHSRTVTSHKTLLKDVYKLVGIRYLPQMLKKYCWFDAEEFDIISVFDTDNGDVQFSWWNADFLSQIENVTADVTEPCFRFFHLEGTHTPFNTNANLETDSSVETTIEEEGQGCILLMWLYCNKLKELGVYDNSTIVIMADHGYHGLRANPMLMLKEANESHEFAVDETKVSYYDIAEYLEAGIAGDSIKDKIATNDKNNDVRYFRYNSNDLFIRADGYGDEITEYYTSGNAWDEESFVLMDIINDKE